MRRIAAVLGLVVVLAAVGYTQLPFSREPPRTTAFAASGYGAVGWGRAVETQCANSWQHGNGWCTTAGQDRRTGALAVGGTAALCALVMILVLPGRRLMTAEPSFCTVAQA